MTWVNEIRGEQQNIADSDNDEENSKSFGTVRLTNFDIENHKVFINGNRVKPNYLKEIEIDEANSIVLRVEQRGAKHYIKNLDFSTVDYYKIEVPPAESISYGHIYTSRGCQMKGVLTFELWGEKRIEAIPMKNKLGISLPIKGDGRFPASDDGGADYTLYYRKKGESIERKLNFNFDDYGTRIDLCDL